jgi:hypothetical protein
MTRSVDIHPQLVEVFCRDLVGPGPLRISRESGRTIRVLPAVIGGSHGFASAARPVRKSLLRLAGVNAA